MRERTFGVVLIVLGLAGLIGTAWAFAARSDSYGSRRWMTYGPVAGLPVGPTCDPPTLPGQTVDVRAGRPPTPRAFYRAYLAQSHILVGIYWQRYGWVAPDESVSGLEERVRPVGRDPRPLLDRLLRV